MKYPDDETIVAKGLVGCLWEGGWDLHANVVVCEKEQPCPHCHSRTEEVEYSYDKKHSWIHVCWTCPRVVVAWNEGGCCSTGICYDCILEYAKQNEAKENGG